MANNNNKNNGLAHALYEQILRTSNYFLHNCRAFPLATLKGQDPSYSEIAQGMKRLAAIISVLAVDFDPMMGQKATEHCDLMSQIGVAISNGDNEALARLVTELERRPGL